jgi:hypothetical protein
MIVMSKGCKRHGVVYPASPTEYQAYFGKFVKGGYDSITMHKAQRDGSIKQGVTLRLGDEAEYDSYNLSYTGKITKITEKCVTIVAYPGSRNAKTHRLDLNAFCWRNWDFDAVDTARKNSDTMNYI